MSTTSATDRVLRSGSKARSDGGSGPSAVVPRAIVTARSTRGRGSRRGGSPAETADLPANDAPTLNPTSNRAYGTTGKPAIVQQQSASLSVNQALAGIDAAVIGAEASTNPTPGHANGLAPVDEEDENGAAGNGPFAGPFSAGFAQRAHIADADTNWGPRHPRNAPGIGSMYSQGLRDGRGGLTPVQGKREWALQTANAMFDAFKIPLLTFMALGFAIFLMNLLTPLAFEKTFGKTFGLSSPMHGTHNITDLDYSMMQRRLDRVEQHLRGLPNQIFTSSTSTPIQHQINWFTPGFDASIDIELSSPTAAFCDPMWKPWPLSRFFRQSCPELPLSPPQKMALQTWEDPIFDRWCAPRSGGKLQLAVQIERQILPTELTVEYMPMAATPTGYMSSAPREVELWVRIEDDEVRAKLSATINDLYPELWQDDNLQGRVLHAVQDLGKEYVPVGRWEYNIRQQENVQGFKIPSPLLSHDFSTDKFAIRVNSNWGNVEFTCINRLRMYGSDKSGITEVLEDDPFQWSD